MTVSLTILFAIAGFFAVLFKLSRIGNRPKDYPPGPPTLPLLGNIHQVHHKYENDIPDVFTEQTLQMPTRDAHLQLQKWAKEYGPVYSLMLGTKVLIILSSDEAVKELLDKRSGIYSARPDMYIGQTLCSGGLRLLMMVGSR